MLTVDWLQHDRWRKTLHEAATWRLLRTVCKRTRRPRARRVELTVRVHVQASLAETAIGKISAQTQKIIHRTEAFIVPNLEAKSI